jgi:hypothetical protein
MKHYLTLVLLATFLVSSNAFAQTTWYVDASAAGPGSGTQQDPYAELQFGLAQSSTVDGDTVLVAAGTYTGPFDFLGKDVSVRSIAGPSATALDGDDQLAPVVSFVNGEGPGARLEGFTVTGGRGALSSWAPTDGRREGGGILCDQSSPTLDRLVITGNRATRGAGVLLLGSSALLQNCELQANLADWCCCFGLAVFSDSLTARIESCTIENHGAGTAIYGGGICGQVTVRNSTFRNNGGASGGAILSLGCLVEGCTFVDNFQAADSAQIVGSGAALSHLGPDNGGYWIPGMVEVPTVMRGCVFAGNLAAIGGAVASKGTGFLRVEDSEFFGNQTRVLSPADDCCPGRGGAAYRATLVDCLFSGNVGELGGALSECIALRCEITGNRSRRLSLSSEYGGGGAHETVLVDCVLSYNSVTPSPEPPFPREGRGGGSLGGSALRTVYFRNTAEVGGAAMGGGFERCTMVDNNGTVRGNSMAGAGNRLVTARNVIGRSGSVDEVSVTSSTHAAVTFSNIGGGFPGVGNFDSDPLFFGPEAGDFQLKPASPCIDTGDPAADPDPDGSRSDVGAFPFDPSHTGTPTSWCVSKVNSLGCEPIIRSTGTPSASGAGGFTLVGENFIGSSFGLLFWGRAPNGIDFQGGTLCVGGTLTRAGLQLSQGVPGTCGGTFVFPFSASYAASVGVLPYETLYAQWIARDAANPDGTGWSLSNALEFTILP